MCGVLRQRKHRGSGQRKHSMSSGVGRPGVLGPLSRHDRIPMWENQSSLCHLQYLQLRLCLPMQYLTPFKLPVPPSLPSQSTNYLSARKQRGRLRTHIGMDRNHVYQGHSEKVIKISNVLFKPSASLEFSRQLLSHSLGAGSSPERLPELP